MLKNWLHIFLFHIKKNKLFTSLNILGLSIGIAGLIFAILYWNNEKSFDDWNPNKNNIFLLVNQVDENIFWTSGSAAVGSNLISKSSDVASYCYISGDYDNDIVRFGKKKILSNKILSAQKNFFEFFPFEFVKGTAKNAFPDENSICLSQEMATQLFGNEPALNKEISYQGKKLVVRGVYKLDKKSSYLPSCVISFMESRIKKYINHWGNFQFVLLIKAKNIESKDKITATINQLYYDNMVVRWAKEQGISTDEYIEKFGVSKVSLEALSEVRLHTKTGGLAEGKGNYKFLVIMMGLSLLILFLSIFNYVNLSTARAVKRAKEVGVRKILGASKTNIIAQFVFETLIIVLFSILCSLVLVELALPYYNDFLDKTLSIKPLEIAVQLGVIFMVLIITAGVFPALYVSNFEVLKVLRGNFSRSKSGIWLRNAMLVLQFAIAAFFIVGSYIVYQQINYMNTKDLGFKANQIVNIKYRNVYGEAEEINDKFRFDRYTTIKNELLKIKGVKQVAGGAFEFGNGAPTTIDYSYKDVSVSGQNIPVDFGMLEMMQIKMVKGRYFSPKFAQDTIDTMLINETALKLLNEPNPIGKKVDWDGKEVTIVGVVKDFNIGNPSEVIPPMSFFHLKTIPWFMGTLNNIYIDAESEKMEQTLVDIEKFWLKKVDANYPFSYDFVDKEYKRSYSNFVKQKNLFSVLNIIVILIALFGLFALATYSIQNRMKEIAIRKTLGAETNSLLKMLSKQYIIFCVLGFLIALFPTYYLLNLWLEDFAFRIDISLIPFSIGFVVLLSLTLFVVLSRAYVATKVDVLKYLKYE
ncbi:FtsX-like permease family protein [uncultured Flavobacterium sp.]|uniref:ABC transporter permease n=1 Tax=uncultured Flavobacterium sp. TaxID=165435 RepID=UPI0030EC549E|tara:strand:+ start:186869 stop:189298 length:2430 start_codon:yes stop_codon:yes gene_type:complete